MSIVRHRLVGSISSSTVHPVASAAARAMAPKRSIMASRSSSTGVRRYQRPRVRSGTMFGAAPPWVMIPCTRSPGFRCCRHCATMVWSSTIASSAFFPSHGSALAWARTPWNVTPTSVTARHSDFGCVRICRVDLQTDVDVVEDAGLDQVHLPVARLLCRSADEPDLPVEVAAHHASGRDGRRRRSTSTSGCGHSHGRPRAVHRTPRRTRSPAPAGRPSSARQRPSRVRPPAPSPRSRSASAAPHSRQPPGAPRKRSPGWRAHDARGRAHRAAPPARRYRASWARWLRTSASPCVRCPAAPGTIPRPRPE